MLCVPLFHTERGGRESRREREEEEKRKGERERELKRIEHTILASISMQHKVSCIKMHSSPRPPLHALYNNSYFHVLSEHISGQTLLATRVKLLWFGQAHWSCLAWWNLMFKNLVINSFSKLSWSSIIDSFFPALQVNQKQQQQQKWWEGEKEGKEKESGDLISSDFFY